MVFSVFVQHSAKHIAPSSVVYASMLVEHCELCQWESHTYVYALRVFHDVFSCHNTSLHLRDIKCCLMLSFIFICFILFYSLQNSMAKNNDIQMTIRIDPELYNPCKSRADDAGQTLAEWIRRAMKDKLERENSDKVYIAKSEAELEQFVERVVFRIDSRVGTPGKSKKPSRRNARLSSDKSVQ